MDKFKTVIIGGGPAGYTAALKLAELLGDAAKGKICLIENSEKKIGGTCLNEGCIPVKSLAESAGIYYHIKNSTLFGLDAEVKKCDPAKLAVSGKANIAQLKNGILSLLKNAGVKIIFGNASFLDKTTLSVTESSGVAKISSEQFIIATGSLPKAVSAFPVNGRNILFSNVLLELTRMPEKLLVIGGGAIGCEFASIYRRFGAEVTVVEMLPHLLPAEDEDISRALEREFQKKGIAVITEGKVKSLADKNGIVEAVIADGGEDKALSFDTVLVAAGRSPNTGALCLEKAGIKTEKGFIAVDHEMRTNVPDIFAAGDVVNSPAYAHIASREGTIAAESCAGHTGTKINYMNIPRIVFTDPQVASTGLSEKDAASSGQEITVYKKFFKSNGKAVIMKDTAGFIKVLAGKDSGKILGASIIGPMATELIHELCLAAGSGLTVKDIGGTVHGHPTLSELTGDVCS